MFVWHSASCIRCSVNCIDKQQAIFFKNILTSTTSMCIFKSQLIDKGTNKVTKENVKENNSVQFDTSASRYDLAIKEVEERVKLGWSVKASFLLGGGYIRVDYVRADPNRYKDVGKTNESKADAEHALSGVGSTNVSVETTEVKVEEVVATDVKETPVKPTRKATTAKKS